MKGLASFANVPKVCGAIVAAGLATYGELKEQRSLEEAYELLEILEVRNYHAWLAQQRLEKENNG